MSELLRRCLNIPVVYVCCTKVFNIVCFRKLYNYVLCQKGKILCCSSERNIAMKIFKTPLT